MMQGNKCLMLALFLFAIISKSEAKNYYVSKSGKDTNSGSFDTPFLTISKAASLLEAGDTCFIMKGVYREILSPANHGQANKPIVFTNYQSDTVLISATEKVENWVHHKDNIYRSSVKMELGRQDMLFCNGNPMDRARWPNNTDGDVYTVEGAKVDGGSGNTILCGSLPNKNWIGGYVWYLGGHSGASWTRKITGASSGKLNFVEVDINKWPFNPHNPTIYRNESRGQIYIFGVADALDYQKEWYFDQGKDSLYFVAPANKDPNTFVTEIGKREMTVDVKTKYIHIDGINTFGGIVNLEGEYCELRNATVKHGMHLLDEFDNVNAQVGGGSVYVGASHVLIENNVIDGGSLNGISVRGWGGISHVELRQNVIKNFNYIGNHSSPIRAGASYMKVISNSVFNTGRDGIYLSGTYNEVAYNDVHHCNRINSDGGAYYTVGNDSKKNTEIHHNWFHDCYPPAYAGYKATGIYLDNNSKGYSVHHNVVFNVAWSGVQMNWDVWDNDIFHNTLWNIQQAMGTWLKEEHQMLRDRVYNNFSSAPDWEGTDIQNNIILTQSPFTDVQNQNFMPKPGSPLIDRAMPIAGVNDDFVGNAPDIGAYEYGVEPWRPGRYTVPVGLPLEVKTKVKDIDIMMYPNPLNKMDLTILANSVDVNGFFVEVYNEKSQRIFYTESTGNELKIPAYAFSSSGLYIVKIITKQGIKVEKIIVQ